jgi:hypothetical protein
MNCTEFLEHLQSRFDGAAVDSADAREHAAHCQECRELETAGGRLAQAIALLPVPQPPVGFAAKITRQIVGERRRRLWQRRLVRSAAAAALVGMLFYTRAQRAPSDLAHVSGPSAATVTAASAPRKQPSLNQGVAEASTVMAELTQRAATETLEQSRLFFEVSLPTRVPGEGLQPPSLSDPALQPLREVKAGVSEGFEPVTTSARRALRLFWKELSPRDRPNKVDI